jgi:hypothetical protein
MGDIYEDRGVVGAYSPCGCSAPAPDGTGDRVLVNSARTRRASLSAHLRPPAAVRTQLQHVRPAGDALFLGAAVLLC